MVDACRDAGVLLMEAFMYRLHPSWLAVRELVASGRIGRLKAVDSWFSYFNDDPANIRNIREAGGGALYDIGCYCVNLSRMLFDAEPVGVQAAIVRDPDLGVDVLTSGILSFRTGVATFTCSTRTETDQRVHVVRHRRPDLGRDPVQHPARPPDADLRHRRRRPAGRAGDRDAHVRDRRPVRLRGGPVRGRGARRRSAAGPARGCGGQPAGHRSPVRLGRRLTNSSRPIRGGPPPRGDVPSRGMSEAPDTAGRGARGDRVTRRTRLIAAGAGLVALVAAVGAAAIVVGSPRSSAPVPPHYVDETTQAGISHTYGGDETYQTGGGVAVFDCDADGRLDVYLAGGGNPAALYRNESPTGGALRFAPLHDPATDLDGVTGAYPLDVDGDGQVDLAVLRVGESVLLRGLGGCRFERANEAWGVAPARALTTAFSATWEGGATAPTLAFGNYMGLDDTGEPTSAASTTRSSARRRLGPDVRRADPARAGILPPLDAVQRLGRVGSTRPAHQQRPALLRQRSRPGAAVAVRTRPAPPPVHARPTDGRSSGSGGWGSRATT